MLRAGPLSDERVRRLANRRFVAFTFDLLPSGALFDKDAKAFLVKKRPEFNRGMISNEPLMILTPDRKNLGETIRYNSTRTVLRMMQKALEKRPEFDKPLPGEKDARPGIERAQVWIDLLKYDEARKELAGLLEKNPKNDPRTTATAHYLLARIARWQKKWTEMDAQLKLAKHPDVRDAAHMERAMLLWHEGEFDELQQHLEGFPRGTDNKPATDSPYFTQARYYHGLALYHQGEKKAALKVWKQAITGCSQDPWVYRADWSYTTVKQGQRGNYVISTGGGRNKRTSPLGRIGYMGGPNPDLQRR